MNLELLVYLDWQGATVRLGTLWARGQGRGSASFAYDPSWLARRDKFAVDPELPVGPGQFHTQRPIFNAFSDSAPDRWGQTLLRRQERQRAKAAGHAPRTLLAGDLVLGVADSGRHGAFRFKTASSGEFLAPSAQPIPPVLALGKLQAAAGRFVRDRDTDADLALLLAPGTSLGGARPKATVVDRDGSLWMAKFARSDDAWPVIPWEATALVLAAQAGIVVAPSRLQVVAKQPILLTRRFDRHPLGEVGAPQQRVPFCSALTAVAATDGQPHSYLEILDVIRRDGAEPAQDAAQLWRRMVLNVLISNTDDHMRNHGLLRTVHGWRLAPAYDMNPIPVDVRPRVHALALDADDPTASLDALLRVAPRFGLRAAASRQIVGEVADAVAQWPRAAARFGLSAAAIERMESAFVHADFEAARRVVGAVR